ncbi:MAG: FG-GAP repeat domain-containing protein, partial [Pirellulales bacterium]
PGNCGRCVGTDRFSHGLGASDINGDGRTDLLVTAGWWEAPAEANRAPWTFHPVDFGPDCAQMVVYDFDGDGDADVVTSSAHQFGIWWHEQTDKGFERHLIDKSFSQTHALCLADINGDHLPDLVTGKRWWAHGGHDPGSDQPAVVKWFELTREAGRPKWIAHTIDEESGIGTQFEVTDVNGDGLLDVVTSNKKGVFYFEQVRAADGESK